MRRKFGNRIYFKTNGKRSHNLANKMAKLIRQNGINARVIRGSKGSSIYVAPKKYNSRFDEFKRIQEQVDTEAFSSKRKPKEIRKLLLMRGRSDDEKVGISMGFVTRKEAADILHDYGIYPTASDFDMAYMDELRTENNMNAIDPSGLASAQLAAKKREEFLANGKARMSGISLSDSRDLSDHIAWTIRDMDFADEEYWTQPLSNIAKSNPGILYDVSYEDLIESYIEYLGEEGFTYEEVEREIQNIGVAELYELFDIDYEMDSITNRQNDRIQKPFILMKKITGYRKGDQIGEWNEVEPIKSKIRLKRKVDLTKPGVMEQAKRLIWNMEFDDFIGDVD